MKLRFLSWVLCCACLAMVQGCDKGDSENEGKSVEDITVTGTTGYTKMVLTVGMPLWPGDQENTVEMLSPYFDGFEVLIAEKGAHPGGVIIPEHDGIVYILSPVSVLPDGWTAISGNSVGYTPAGEEIPASLSIYSKLAYAGKPVQIPVISGDMAVYPLGRHITYIPEE